MSYSENDLPRTNKRSREDDEEVRASQRSRRTCSPRSEDGLPSSRALTPFDCSVNSVPPSRPFTFVDCNLHDGRPPVPPLNKLAAVGVQCWVPEKVTIQDVQNSYNNEIESGRLHSTLIPHLLADNTPNATWNPYNLRAAGLCTACLNTEKIDRLHKRLQGIKDVVPVAAKWKKQIENHGLTPVAMLEILRAAFGHSHANQFQPRPDKTGYRTPAMILVMAQYFFDQAGALEKKSTVARRAVAIDRLVGYALMRVFEVVYNLTPAQVCTISFPFSTALTQSGRRIYEAILQR